MKRAEHEIECPYCAGSGVVPEDFLTVEHVDQVFEEYCNIFGIHKAYGVESYNDWYGPDVEVKQNISFRGCYDYKIHNLPRTWFTRNPEKRKILMQQEKDKHDEIERQSRERNRIQEITQLEARLNTLKNN